MDSPALIVAVDKEAGEAAYLQVYRQVHGAIASGRLHPGSRLPPVRRLATELGLAVNTVARAYQMLEADGLLDTRGRHGSFVLPPGQVDTVSAAAASYVRFARERGLADEAIAALVGYELGNQPR